MPIDTSKKLLSYSVGLHNVGSYQVSGIPYITGSSALSPGDENKLEFPMVARNITVVNHSTGSLRVHFNAKDSGDVYGGFHYVELDSDEDSISMSVKCREIYVSCPAGLGGVDREYRVIAELTQIGVNRMYALTGSGLTD
tara:strand:- start:24 stop:443 length:420 start_codon:yes stop_codon:yes gene_type:complete